MNAQGLKGKVAIVAGATRGAGRGIACMLGESGATVYCTGRSTREHPPTGIYTGRPETIEETAEMVARHGGNGIAVRTDHLAADQVQALVERVRHEQGRLDILVNDISEADTHQWKPFWKLDVEKGFAMLRNALNSHILTCRYAVPLMLEHPGGLVVEIGDGDTLDYRAALFYDLVKISVSRLAYAMAEDLHSRGACAVAVTPGFLRSEMVLDHFGVTETNWREAGKKEPTFLASETPFFVGRAIAALAMDPRRMEKSGGLYSSWGLGREYGVTDVDGSRPDFSKHVDIAAHFAAYAKTPFRWTVARREAAQPEERG